LLVSAWSAAAAAKLRDRTGQLNLGAPLAIRVNPRARRMSLRVDAATRTIELVMPRGAATEHGVRFVDAHRGWIAARLDALPVPVRFEDGAIIPVLGVPHRIRHHADRGASPVSIGDGEILVRGDAAFLARRVRDHLVKLARQEFGRRARGCAARIGRSVVRVAVRDTKSRWGSCSSTGNLSFSWRLILAPEAVIDYVVAHEVAHLAEMNHGPRFWRLVAGLAGDHVGPRGWLKRHRNRLLSYG
jgi:predicted metal-dependent hydrolase